MQPSTQYSRTLFLFIYQNIWIIDKCEGYLPLTTKNKRRQTKARKNRVKETEILELKFQTWMLKAMAQQRREVWRSKADSKEDFRKPLFLLKWKERRNLSTISKKMEVWDWIYFGLFAFNLLCREGDSVRFFSFNICRKLNDFYTIHRENESFSTSNNFLFLFSRWFFNNKNLGFN